MGDFEATIAETHWWLNSAEVNDGLLQLQSVDGRDWLYVRPSAVLAVRRANAREARTVTLLLQGGVELTARVDDDVTPLLRHLAGAGARS